MYIYAIKQNLNSHTEIFSFAVFLLRYSARIFKQSNFIETVQISQIFDILDK